MQEIDINTLIDHNNRLNENIPNDVIIVNKRDKLIIDYKYNKLDLSKVKCKVIYYNNQEGESIKNHILPNSLNFLHCSGNQLTLLPNLPNSLKGLYCSNNQLISLPELPNSLEELRCSNNQLTSLPNLSNSLIELYCRNNNLKSLPDLPNSLQRLYCHNNELTSLPNLNTCFKGYNEVDYINYDPNYEESKIKFLLYYNGNKWVNSYIEIKDYGKITSKEEYIRYMEKIKLNKIKSAKK